MRSTVLPLLRLRRLGRRALLAAASMSVASPVLAQGARVRRVGFLSSFPEDDGDTKWRTTALVKRLDALGWRVGHNLKMEYGYAYGDAASIAAAVKDMVARAPDVIVTVSNPVALALARETQTIPVVFASVADPVGSGIVSSLARPGGNVTGFANMEPSIGGKWIELLKEAKPSLRRVLALHHAPTPAHQSFLRAAQAAAPGLGITVEPASVNTAAEIAVAIAAFGDDPAGGVMAMPHPVTATGRRAIVEHATRQRLPSIAAFRYFAAAGMLMSYGNDGRDLFDRAVEYADRILRGTRPGELPVQTPTRVELFINLKAARTIGLELSATLLARADEIID